MAVGPSFQGADPDKVYATESDHAAQTQSQEWTFITPTAAKEAEEAAALTAKKEEGEDEDSPSAHLNLEGGPAPPLPLDEEATKALASVPVPPKMTSTLIKCREYAAPHKFLRWMRGVPMDDIEDRHKPAMNHPIDAQQLMALHMERVGLVHVDELHAAANELGWLHVNQLPTQVIKHRKPRTGPDIAINPGTWHDVNEELGEDEESHGHSDDTVPDLSGISETQMIALKEAIRREEIRQKYISQSEVGIQRTALSTAALRAEADERAKTTPQPVPVTPGSVQTGTPPALNPMERTRADVAKIRAHQDRSAVVSSFTSDPGMKIPGQDAPVVPTLRTQLPSNPGETFEQRVQRERIQHIAVQNAVAAREAQDTGSYTAMARIKMEEARRRGARSKNESGDEK